MPVQASTLEASIQVGELSRPTPLHVQVTPAELVPTPPILQLHTEEADIRDVYEDVNMGQEEAGPQEEAYAKEAAIPTTEAPMEGPPKKKNAGLKKLGKINQYQKELDRLIREDQK